MVTQTDLEDFIKENIRYDKENGGLWWKTQKTGVGRRREMDRPLGKFTRRNSDGYIRVRHRMLGHELTLSRIAWFLEMGAWPTDGHDIHHKNEDSTDNRWSNLEEVCKKSHGSLSALSRWQKYHAAPAA